MNAEPDSTQSTETSDRAVSGAAPGAQAARSGGLGVCILAAGKGTRMRSPLPKVLQPVCGVPMVQHVLDAVRPLKPNVTAVVVGHGADAVREALAGNDGITFVE